MRRRLRSLIVALLVAASPLAAADLVVVVNPRSGVDRLSRQDVVYLFMGRVRQLPSGVTAIPLDLAVDSPERVAFYRQLVNKETAEIRAYWTRLIFSGGARPPQAVDGAGELARLIANNTGAIGYLDRSLVDGRMKIVYEFYEGP